MIMSVQQRKKKILRGGPTTKVKYENRKKKSKKFAKQ